MKFNNMKYDATSAKHLLDYWTVVAVKAQSDARSYKIIFQLGLTVSYCFVLSDFHLQ